MHEISPALSHRAHVMSGRRQVSKILACLCAAFALCGCATRTDLVVLKSLNAQRRSFDFFDLRPADQFTTRTQREENGDRTYYGDEVVTPSRVELLGDNLQATLGKELRGKTVVISTFRLQTMQYTNRGGPSYYSTGNPIADLVGVAIGRELMAATMRSNELSVYIQVVGKIDEQEITADTSSTIGKANIAQGLADNVHAAIEQFTQKSMKALIPPPPNSDSAQSANALKQ